MRTFQTLAGLLTAVLATAGVASADDGPLHDSATGTGHFTVQDVAGDVHVNAKSGPLGEDAKGHFIIRLVATSPVVELNVSGSVTCLTVVANAATIGGVVESTDNPQIPEGTGILIGIVDNGSPGQGQDAVSELVVAA